MHGNLPGLEAILADVERRGIARRAQPRRPRRLRALPQRGRRAAARARHPLAAGQLRPGHRLLDWATAAASTRPTSSATRAPSRWRWTDAVTSDETRAYLRTLEDRFVLDTPAGELLAVHGSPRRINEYLFEDRPEGAMARMAEQNPYRAILFGHTHVPYAREVAHGDAGASTLFVNVGSGGRPKDGDWRVCYALVDPAALAAGEPAVEFVRVPYDYERLAAGARRHRPDHQSSRRRSRAATPARPSRGDAGGDTASGGPSHRRDATTLVPRPLPHALDLPRDARRRRSRAGPSPACPPSSTSGRWAPPTSPSPSASS